MLLGFARVDLDAGEQAEVTFEVSADRFAYCGRQGRIVDSGAIELMLGHSSTDIAHRALLEVTGTTRSRRQRAHPDDSRHRPTVRAVDGYCRTGEQRRAVRETHKVSTYPV